MDNLFFQKSVVFIIVLSINKKTNIIDTNLSEEYYLPDKMQGKERCLQNISIHYVNYLIYKLYINQPKIYSKIATTFSGMRKST